MNKEAKTTNWSKPQLVVHCYQKLLPEGLPFELVNQTMTKKVISRLIDACYRQVGIKETVIFADQLMYTGFHYATRSGISIGVE